MIENIGKKRLLKIYFDTDDKCQNIPVWEYILAEAKKYNLAGVTVYKSISGLGSNSEVHTSNIWALSQTLPLVVEIIDDAGKISDFINHISSDIKEALIVQSDVEVSLIRN